ncbi:GMC oxidoreductase [Cadophora sp. DSE1049]|nr:GMC oxidoreductase [Cadophora sp. DSE1049]
MAQVKTKVSELRQSYDYIVVGGGTSGLTVGDRLSEDGTRTVLVVEYGYLEDSSPDILLPSPANNDRNMSRFYDYMSIPQTELNDKATIAYAAAIVGGGSAVDHMMFDRGSADDYDNWEKLQNPGWGWKGLLPYFQKSVTFTPPTLEQQQKYGYTYDESAYGGNGPIHASYPPFQWPQQKLQWNAWLDLGIEATKEGAGGEALGLFWIPSAMNPKNETRSYSKTGHYDSSSLRENCHLLTGYQTREIVISNLRAEGITIQARSGTDTTITTISATREVILAAGAFGSPILLQRSGVGPKALLESAGIEVKVDLPGVGQNFQDHAATLLLYTYATNPEPNTQTTTTNATFKAEVETEYYNQRTGPMTVGYGNSVVFLPLPTIDPNYEALVARLAAQDSAALLPPTYGKTLRAGYALQKELLLASLASKKSAILEVFFNGDPSTVLVLQKPLSRGTVSINPASPYSNPIIDPRVFTNPIDLEMDISMIKYVRKWFQAPSQASLTPVEVLPGSTVQSDEEITAAIRQLSVPTLEHALGTCSMMPLELSGVVGSDLLVHGVEGLSVVDASIMPLAPATHLDATVYAVAEKAADLIKSRAK